MVTISFVVESLLERRPFVQEALAQGLINNAALAEELIPEVEKILRRKVKFSAVNMSIRRLSEKLNKIEFARPKFDENSDITIKTSLTEITIIRAEETKDLIKRIYNQIDVTRGDFITITQGVNEITVITNNKLESKFKKILPQALLKKRITDLSSITINLPSRAVNVIGLFYIVSKTLAWNNINIVEVVSTLTELSIIVSDSDTSEAFNIIKELISQNSR